MSADADLDACRALLAGGSRSFATAARLLPRRVRDPATALYAFCRIADDLVDLGGGAAALPALHARLARAYAGDPWPHPADRAFAATVAAHGIPAALPQALLEGFAWDAEGRRYADLAALEAYAMRVAGSVGLMLALVMGVRSPAALARAAELGCAMQLTNIARDVGEDARNGRLYLPLDWLAEAGIVPDRFLADPAPSPALAGVVARLLTAADALYARGRAGIAALPRDCRPGIQAAAALYAAIGRAVERGGRDPVTRRAVVPRPLQVALLLAGLAAGMRPALSASRADPSPMAAALPLLRAIPVPVAAPRGLEARVAWLVDLFIRLERGDRQPA